MFSPCSPLSNLDSDSHSGKEPAVVDLAAHPAAVQFEDGRHKTLPGFDGCGALLVRFSVPRREHFLDHALAGGGFIHPLAGHRDELHGVGLLQSVVNFLIVRFAIHEDLRDGTGVVLDLLMPPLRFIGRGAHPLEEANDRG